MIVFSLMPLMADVLCKNTVLHPEMNDCSKLIVNLPLIERTNAWEQIRHPSLKLAVG